MSQNPLISVVIPCYNAEKYISETIYSVLGQTHQNFEIIVIDDGSVDNSGQVVGEISKKDQRITYQYQPNKGMCATRNVGLSLCSGKYVLFLDNDDIIGKSFIADRVAFLEMNPEYGLCGSKILKIDSEGNEIQTQIVHHSPTENMLREILLYDKQVSSIPSNFLVRKSIMDSNGIRFNESLSSTGDKYFLIEMAYATKCSNIKADQINYRIHGGSMSAKLSDNLFKDNELFIQLIQKRDLIPKDIKAECLVKNYYMLSAMSFKLGNYLTSLKYLLLLGSVYPSYIWMVVAGENKEK